MKNLFEQRMEEMRLQYLGEDMSEAQDKREVEELEKLDDDVRKKKIKLKKGELKKVKQQEMKSKQHGTAL